MKNVLFATTALVALAGAASAQVTVSGKTTFGYNNTAMGGLYSDGSFTLRGDVDLGDNVTAYITWGASFEFNNDANDIAAVGLFNPNGGTDDDGVSWNGFPTVGIAYTGNNMNASLEYGPLAVASGKYYKSRAGMTTGLESASKSDTDILAVLGFGDFSLAVGCNGVGDGVCDGLNYGLGATFGSITLGAGFDDANNGARAIGVSADATFGALSVGVSYATATGIIASGKTDGDDADYFNIVTPTATVNALGTSVSIGLSAAYAISDAFSVDASFATNADTVTAARATSYAIGASYTAGALTVKGAYANKASLGFANTGVDADGDGVSTTIAAAPGYTQTTTISADIVYAVNDAMSVLVGGQSSAATGNIPSIAAFNYYAGVKYTVNDNVSLTASFATAKKLGGGFQPGMTASISASF